jgi:ribulose-bisphosphate carboxylase large chain
MKPTTPIISGGMNALRLPGFFENLGHGNVINTAGGGSYGHIDSPAAGAISLRQSYECWKSGADPIEFAKEPQGIRPRLRVLPQGCRQAVPGLARKARRRTSKPHSGRNSPAAAGFFARHT